MTADRLATALTLLVVGLSGLALLWIARRAGRRRARYQAQALVLALAVWGIARLMPGQGRPVTLLGELSAPVRGLGWMGVGDGETWGTLLLTTGAIIVLVTGVTLWLQVGRGSGLVGRVLLGALPAAALLSLANATTEELIFRVALLQGVPDTVLGAGGLALVSGILFGLPHYGGRPGGAVGVVLAGFLGWLACTATLQTGGIGWAWVLHVVLDVVILGVVIAAERSAPGSAATGAGDQPGGAARA